MAEYVNVSGTAVLLIGMGYCNKWLKA